MDLALFAALGIAVGAIGTLIGAGGGFILVPLLLFLHPDWPPERVTAISMFAVLCNATSGSIGYARLRRIDYTSGIIFAIATLPGALLGAAATHSASRAGFNVVLGVVLALMATVLIARAGKPRPNGDDHGPAAQVQSARQRVLGVAISAAVGFVATFLGIGGGIIHVPALTFLLGFPIHIAVGTSHFVLAITAAAGTAVHISRGDLSGHWPMTLAIGAGAVLGAQLGARLARTIKGPWIVRGLATAMILVAARVVWVGVRGH